MSIPTLPAPEAFNFFFKKHELLQKTENLHAALDWEVGNPSKKLKNCPTEEIIN